MRHDLRAIRIAIVTLAVIACLTIGVAAGELLAPTAIAIVLALVLAPASGLLERYLKIPSGFAAVLSVVLTISVLVSAIVTFAPSASYWMERAPQIVKSVETKLAPIKQTFETLQAQIERASTKQPAQNANAGPASAPAGMVDSTKIVTSLALFAPGALAQLFYVTIMTIFLLAFRAGYSEQLVLLPRHFAGRVRMARIIRDVRLRVSGYLFTLATINVCLIPIIAIALMIAGISDPILWGIVYAVLNFIPIIGPTCVILAATLVGLATAPTLLGALVLPAILLSIHAIESNVVQPLLVARRVVVSPIAIFAMVAILVWMWGPFASITAVPILILLHTVMVHVASMKPFAALLATEHSSHAHHTHYVKHKRHHHVWLRRKPYVSMPSGQKKISPAVVVPQHPSSGPAPDTAHSVQ
ncbi:MAG TPA: AI-2E family transporter [Rhizomicrobium sp.]|jgi:predicted PurR-regulated permease PerM